MKGKKRISKGKGNRWKKGHSSDSNPTKKIFRQAAKSRFFNTDYAGSSNLTVDALAKHDTSVDDDIADAGSDTQSTAGKTTTSWASNWTECTNTTFSKVHRYWNSNDASHKEILAVLAAVTEVIKAQGGKETEAEYFAALMTALSTVEGEQSTAAVAYLLSLAMNKVSTAVLKLKFSEVSKVLLDTIAAHASTDMPSLLKSLLSCLASLLKAQEQAIWANSSTTQIYNGMLAFITHNKPKIRKAAQEAVRVILKRSEFMLSDNAPPHHPVAALTAKHCCKVIEQSGGGDDTFHSTLYVLELLRDVLPTFPQHSLKSTAETILRVMTLGNFLITSVAMRCLHGVFVSQPSSGCLPADLNGQLITAMYDYQPSLVDVQPLSAWLAVMESAQINLARLDGKLAVSHLPRFVTVCMNCLRSEKVEAIKAAAQTLKALMTSVIGPQAEAVTALVAGGGSVKNTPLHKIWLLLVSGLGYQFHAAWGNVLNVLGAAFTAMGQHMPQELYKPALVAIADLRETHNFPFKAELDDAVGAAISGIGASRVLDAVPLQLTGAGDDLDLPRSWMLPVIQKHTHHDALAFFTTSLLPLAAQLRAASVDHEKRNLKAAAHTYNALQAQLWALLPSFSTHAVDVCTAFPGLARALGTALTDRADLCSDVLTSLRRLIAGCKEKAEDTAILAKFSKNFLPILFNIWSSEDKEKEDPGARYASLDTIKSYLSITDAALISTFFDKSLLKVSDSGVSAFQRAALLDLLIAMIPYLDANRIKNLYNYFSTKLSSDDRTVQKKSYRSLEEIFSSKSEACTEFVSANLPTLQTSLVESMAGSTPSAKAPRLRCLKFIVESLKNPNMDFMQAVLPEAILCTKEVNVKARQGAFALILALGDAMVRWNTDQDKATTVHQYFEQLLIGLAGSPQMISCTTLALSRVLIMYRSIISTQTLEVLVHSTCLLIKANAREVVLSAIALLKVLVGVEKTENIAQFLPQLVDSLVKMSQDNRHHFRFKTKDIYARLVRKFGFDTVVALVPNKGNMHKILGNIRKTQEKAKRKKHITEEDDEDDNEDTTSSFKAENFDELLPDTDSDMEEDNPSKTKKTKPDKNPKKSAAWLKEEGTEDIVDFLDPSVSKKIMSTKPEKAGTKKSTDSSHGFPMASDGRFIIQEDKEEKNKEGPIIDDVEELLSALDGPKKTKKRKHATGDLVEEEETPMKYQAGGSGIHRPITQKEIGTEYRSKKAGGDMKKKGKPDPYAYVPLEMRSLNRRKRAKVHGQFKNLVKGAKKGAAKGKKQKKGKS